MPDSDDIIHCELCDLPHRRSAVRCDGCDHTLGIAPDWDRLRVERNRLKRRMALGGAALVAMIALNMVFFGGYGAIILVAPIGWVAESFIRHQNVSKQLLRDPGLSAR